MLMSFATASVLAMDPAGTGALVPAGLMQSLRSRP